MLEPPSVVRTAGLAAAGGGGGISALELVGGADAGCTIWATETSENNSKNRIEMEMIFRYRIMK